MAEQVIEGTWEQVAERYDLRGRRVREVKRILRRDDHQVGQLRHREDGRVVVKLLERRILRQRPGLGPPGGRVVGCGDDLVQLRLLRRQLEVDEGAAATADGGELEALGRGTHFSED